MTFYLPPIPYNSVYIRITAEADGAGGGSSQGGKAAEGDGEAG